MAETGDELSLDAGTGAPAPEAERKQIAARLELELNETAAYRAHFRTANKDSLFRPAKTPRR
jgi:hypothetical protein